MRRGGRTGISSSSGVGGTCACLPRPASDARRNDDRWSPAGADRSPDRLSHVLGMFSHLFWTARDDSWIRSTLSLDCGQLRKRHRPESNHHTRISPFCLAEAMGFAYGCFVCAVHHKLYCARLLCIMTVVSILNVVFTCTPPCDANLLDRRKTPGAGRVTGTTGQHDALLFSQLCVDSLI